jgi:SAM-dependent methyltransferase
MSVGVKTNARGGGARAPDRPHPAATISSVASIPARFFMTIVSIPRFSGMLRCRPTQRKGETIDSGPTRGYTSIQATNPMNSLDHWNHIYATRPADQVSWFAPHLQTSLDLIARVPLAPDAAILEVGGGASTLVDDLLARGFTRLTVLDLSQAALDASRTRLGALSEKVRWLAGDITRIGLEPSHYDLWHDRAVFHFFTDPAQRAAYARQLLHALKPGGHAVVSTFGPEGPTRCSGLDVVRYDAHALADSLTPRLRLLHAVATAHSTPSGATQPFVSCLFRLDERRLPADRPPR